MNYIFVNYNDNPAGVPYGSVNLKEVLTARAFHKGLELFIEVIFKTGYKATILIEDTKHVHDFFLTLSRQQERIMHYIFRDADKKPYASIDLFTVLQTSIHTDGSLSIGLNNGDNVVVRYRNNPVNLDNFFNALESLHQE